jgi:hypothetical protein
MIEAKKEKIYNDWKNGNGDDREAYKKMSKIDMLDFIEYCSQFEERSFIINRMRIVLDR